MPTVCCVPNCDSNDRKIGMHSFPASKNIMELERYLKWIEVIGREDLKTKPRKLVVKSHRVCDRHFDAHSRFPIYGNSKFRSKLKRSAVPSLFLPTASDRSRHESPENEQNLMLSENHSNLKETPSSCESSAITNNHESTLEIFTNQLSNAPALNLYTLTIDLEDNSIPSTNETTVIQGGDSILANLLQKNTIPSVKVDNFTPPSNTFSVQTYVACQDPDDPKWSPTLDRQCHHCNRKTSGVALLCPANWICLFENTVIAEEELKKYFKKFIIPNYDILSIKSTYETLSRNQCSWDVCILLNQEQLQQQQLHECVKCTLQELRPINANIELYQIESEMKWTVRYVLRCPHRLQKPARYKQGKLLKNIISYGEEYKTKI